MPEWSNDEELFALIRNELYTCVVGDICDELGLRNQFLGASIQPLDKHRRYVMAGRAATVLEQDIEEIADPARPWGLMLEALDNLGPGDVYLCSGSTAPYALFGELMSTAAMQRGAIGAVCNGSVRDTHQIVALGFPVFCRGSYGLDQRGRGTVVDYGIPLPFGEAVVRPRDLIVGDIDGVLVVPRDSEVDVITRALQKARTESVVRRALLEGMKASDAFAQYGVL